MRRIALGLALLVTSPCAAQDSRTPALAYCKMEYLKIKGNLGVYEADFMKLCMQSKGFDHFAGFGCYSSNDTIACYRDASPPTPPTAFEKAKRWLGGFFN